MNIQYIRLDEDVCVSMNKLALDERRTVSELVNEVLREYLQQQRDLTTHPSSR